MRRLATVLFFSSWLLCGCSIETIFDGGAPLFVVSALVLIGTAMIITK